MFAWFNYRIVQIGIVLGFTAINLLLATIYFSSPKTLVHVDVTAEGPLTSLWKVDCLNGGIGFNGSCVCAPGFYGDICEEDQCTQDVYVKLETFWGKTIDPSEKEKCILNPALFHCYREEIPSIVEEFSNISNPTFLERLHHILRIYGPFTEADKLFFHYWFRGSELTDRHNEQIYSDMPPAPHNRLAFIILLDNDIRRFSQMWKHIYQPHHFYVIHVDLDSSHEFYSTVRALVHRKYNEHRNVEVLTNRFEGVWAGMSLVYMEIAGIIRLMHMDPDHSWTHIINLSGKDFPLKPMWKLEKQLSDPQYVDKSFIAQEMLSRPWRHERLFLECDQPGRRNKVVKISTKRLYDKSFDKSNYMSGRPPKIKYSRHDGSQWHVLSREFAETLVNSQNLDVLELILSYRYTFVPDENIIQTLLETTDLWKKRLRYNLRYIDWGRPNLQLTMEDFPNIKRSAKYFARKVETDDLADALEEELYKQGKEPKK